ncbi:MAG: hypothetical protein AAF216_10945 [Pseudomonadota bacterium]
MDIRTALIAPLALLSACVALPNAEAQDEPEMVVEDLIGAWDVSLYFSADAPPSSTQMTVTAVDDSVLTGSFYGSPFLKGRAIIFDDEVLFTVVTTDGSGEYLISGELDDDEIEGQVLSVGRDFLMAFEAEPTEASE